MGNVVRMRNKQTGEFRDVEDSADEFREMKAAVGPDGFSAWEQTGDHHVVAVKDRADAGAVAEEDLGKEDQAKLNSFVDSPHPALAPQVMPHLELTPGEIEMGLTPESKTEGLKAMYGENAPHVENQAVLQEGAEKIGASDGPEPLSLGDNDDDDDDSGPRRSSRARARKARSSSSRAGGDSPPDAGAGGGDS